MTFGKPRRTTKFRTTNAKNAIENRPKILSKSTPPALQNDLQKNKPQKTSKNAKKSPKSPRKGRPKGEPRMWFSDM